MLFMALMLVAVHQPRTEGRKPTRALRCWPALRPRSAQRPCRQNRVNHGSPDLVAPREPVAQCPARRPDSSSSTRAHRTLPLGRTRALPLWCQPAPGLDAVPLQVSLRASPTARRARRPWLARVVDPAGCGSSCLAGAVLFTGDWFGTTGEPALPLAFLTPFAFLLTLAVFGGVPPLRAPSGPLPAHTRWWMTGRTCVPSHGSSRGLLLGLGHCAAARLTRPCGRPSSPCHRRGAQPHPRHQ